MTVFQTVQNFAPQVSVEYDQEKGAYVGQLFSRGGTYELQGPDRESISYEVDAILRSEYDQLVREVERGRTRSIGGPSRSGGTNAGKVQGHQIMDFTPPDQRERGRGMSFMTALDLFSMVGPTMPSLGAGAPILKMIGLGTGLMEVLEFLLPMGRKKQKLAIVVGGVLIVAGSRRALVKKLLLHKNRMLERIMNSVRRTMKTNERLRDKQMYMSRRLQMKRDLARSDWVGRVGRDRESLNGNWKDRVDSTRNRLREKKANAAVGLWAER